MSPISLTLDGRGNLVLRTADGQEHTGVLVVRGFPISDPYHGIAIVDEAGRELAWIEYARFAS